MPKAADLDIDLDEPTPAPPAATAPRGSKQRPQPERPRYDTPVNVRWPAAEVKAMKRAALEADMSMQEYLLAFVHSCKQDS